MGPTVDVPVVLIAAWFVLGAAWCALGAVWLRYARRKTRELDAVRLSLQRYEWHGDPWRVLDDVADAFGIRGRFGRRG